MSGLFTTHAGEVIEMPLRTDGSELSLHRSPRNCECRGANPLDNAVDEKACEPPQIDGSEDDQPPIERQHLAGVSCSSTSPLIQVVSQEDLPALAAAAKPPPSPSLPTSPVGHSRGRVKSNLVKVNFVYNEYGELVDDNVLRQHQTTDQLSTLQILRLIKKHYHHDLRKVLGKVIVPQYDGGNSVLVDEGIWKTNRLSSWDFRPQTPRSLENYSAEDYHFTRFGQRRVLEIGCSDGSWCRHFKKEYPDWVIDGVDGTNHWMCDKKYTPGKDFNELSWDKFPEEYSTNTAQKLPDFSNRNINRLVLAGDHPIPHDIYEFIRGREIFDRVESYKTLLEDIRLILRPNGVVEFIEIDPRPRERCVGRKLVEIKKKHKSAAETDWTDIIEDRFKDPFDAELATTSAGWSARVSERTRANRRPQDGVPAANLKSWLEGAGFHDVKVVVIPIHVGGDKWSGKFLQDFLKYQMELEDEIPKLRKELPHANMDDLESGKYYLNLHVVTGRKPPYPRPGDLLPNGERQEMTASKYDAMARYSDVKSTQWKRFDLEGKLTTMMKNLTTLPGAPDTITVAPGTAGDGLFPIIGRHSDIESPFHAPPFVTVQTITEARKASLATMTRTELEIHSE